MNIFEAKHLLRKSGYKYLKEDSYNKINDLKEIKRIITTEYTQDEDETNKVIATYRNEILKYSSEGMSTKEIAEAVIDLLCNHNYDQSQNKYRQLVDNIKKNFGELYNVVYHDLADDDLADKIGEVLDSFNKIID